PCASIIAATSAIGCGGCSRAASELRGSGSHASQNANGRRTQVAGPGAMPRRLRAIRYRLCGHWLSLMSPRARSFPRAPCTARIHSAVSTPSVWGARLEAAPDDVLTTWKQLVALHRQWHSLLKELRDAEQALGQDPTEANYSWLQDVKARLGLVDGTEALIEGFGASSGRAVQSL